MSLFEEIERQGVYGALGKAAGAVALEPSSAPMLEKSLGENAPRRIARAEKEDVVGLHGHQPLLRGTAGRGAAGFRGSRLRCGFGEWRFAVACGALIGFSELGERSLAVDRRLAVGEKGFPGHALRIGDPLLVGLGVTAGGALRLDDRPVGAAQPVINLGQ